MERKEGNLKGKRWKIENGRGKWRKWAEDLFFSFFLSFLFIYFIYLFIYFFAFHFLKPLKFVWGLPNWQFLLGKSIFHVGKKLIEVFRDWGFTSFHLTDAYKMLHNRCSSMYNSHIDCKIQMSIADMTVALSKRVKYSKSLSNLCILSSCTQACRKRCGMVAVAAPKICREKERKGREGRKEREKRRKKRERRKKERNGEKSKRCIRPMNSDGLSKRPYMNCQKIIKYTKRGGGLKKACRKRGRRDRKGRRKLGDRGQIEMWEYRICISFKY